MVWRPWTDNGGVVASFYDRTYSREKIQDELGLITPLIVLKQIHSAEVIQINQSNLCEKFEGDACVTNLKEVALSVHTADCLPLLACDGDVVGACHGGWRGVSRGIIENWVAALGALGAKKDRLKVAIGPSIGPCHFEVGKDVGNLLTDPSLPTKFEKVLRLKHDDQSKEYFNLRELARFKLLKLGIQASNLSVSEECTFCDKNRYFSYRRDGSQLGRLEAVILRRKD